MPSKLMASANANSESSTPPAPSTSSVCFAGEASASTPASAFATPTPSASASWSSVAAATSTQNLVLAATCTTPREEVLPWRALGAALRAEARDKDGGTELRDAGTHRRARWHVFHEPTTQAALDWRTYERIVHDILIEQLGVIAGATSVKEGYVAPISTVWAQLSRAQIASAQWVGWTQASWDGHSVVDQAVVDVLKTQWSKLSACAVSRLKRLGFERKRWDARVERVAEIARGEGALSWTSRLERYVRIRGEPVADKMPAPRGRSIEVPSQVEPLRRARADASAQAEARATLQRHETEAGIAFYKRHLQRHVPTATAVPKAAARAREYVQDAQSRGEWATASGVVHACH
jgi:hypothetical protein